MVADNVKSLIHVIAHTNNKDSDLTVPMRVSILSNRHCRKIRLVNAK